MDERIDAEPDNQTQAEGPSFRKAEPLDWEYPARNLETANLRVATLYQAITMLIEAKRHDPYSVEHKIDLLLHPSHQAEYDEVERLTDAPSGG